MGMTRDEALKVWLPVIQMGVETMPECKEALDIAVETMRKYQDIQERIKAEMSFGNPNMDVKNVPGLTRTLEIFEGIENGNVD